MHELIPAFAVPGPQRRGLRHGPGPLIDRFMAASDGLRAALVGLSAEMDYRLWFDPFWTRIQLFDAIVNVG